MTKKELLKTHGIPRSPHWPKVRKEFLKENPNCAVCGYSGKKSEVHHIQSFVEHPELELLPENLINLCESDPNQNHHLQAGHLGCFRMINPNSPEDAKCWGEKIRAAKEELKKRESDPPKSL